MLKDKGAALGLAFFLALAVFGVWESVSSSRPPEQQRASNTPDNATSKNQRSVEARVLDRLDSSRIWIGDSEHLEAASTAIIAIFTATLFFATFGQLRHLKRSVALARDEFNAAHRPHIVVRGTTLIPGTTVKTTSGAAEGPAIIDFDAANAGESNARIISFIASGYFQSENDAFLPRLYHTGIRERPTNLVMEPGTHALVRATCANLDWEYENWKGADGRMFVIGEVEYSGPDKIVRMMGFCREYNPTGGEWKPPQYSVYEYN